MKKKNFIILTVLMTCIFSLDVYADTNIGKANSKLRNVENSISDKKTKIKRIAKHQQQVKDELSTLDGKIRKTSGQISTINLKIHSVSISTDKLSDDISRKKEDIKKQQKLLDKRVNTLYKEGNFGYLTILFGAKNISDLLQKAVYLAQIVNMDKNLIRELNKSKDNLEKDQKQFLNKRKQLISMKSLANDKMNELNSQSDEKQKLMKRLDKDKNEYARQIEEDEKAAKELTNKIQNMKAMILEAKREAARRKAEEARKAKQQDSSQNNRDSSSNESSDSSPVKSGSYYCVTGSMYPITSGYGYRIHPITHKRTFHSGIDIGVPNNTPIYALADGIVTYASWMNGYGNVVMIAHGDIISVYAHNSSLSVSAGERVEGGQLISHSGSTGNSTGPHLHFEIRDNSGNTLNPVTYYVH